MAASDWNWRYPVELQDVPWDCAAASLTWALNAFGFPISEAEVVAGLGPTRISPTFGLLDASGAGLVEYLAELGIPAQNNPDASWQEVETAAGFQPMVVGGREWCHWSAVRMGSSCFYGTPRNALLLANPAPGWCGVQQALFRVDFDQLGPFSAVWFPV
jgi:hypothetical protein